MSTSNSNKLKRDVTVILDDPHIDSPSPPPTKKRKLNRNQTPIFKLTPAPTKHHNDKKIAIIRCKSGHGMIPTQNKNKATKTNTIKCTTCRKTIKQKETYFRCPNNNTSDCLCVKCFEEEKTQYTGSIRLGQRVRLNNARNEWKLGSILKHWPQDDMYTIQIDGKHRCDAEAYDIYDAFWKVQLVDNHQLKPTPTRMISQCDTGGSVTSVPRCLSGCRMMTMDAQSAYDEDDDGDEDHCKTLRFDDDDGKMEGGIFCNKCGKHVSSGKIYHCPNATHREGYDLCIKCSKKNTKLPPTLISYDLKGLAAFIASDKCKSIGILCGAGISRSAGIPDFRSKNGIYKSLSKDLRKNVIKYGLTLRQKRAIEEDAQYVFSIDLFKENPTVLYHVLADILTKRCKPTITHCFFKLLQDRGLLKYVFTQNVDGLERYIGIDPKILTEVHGTFLSAACYKCAAEYNIAEVRKHVQNMDIPIKCKNKQCHRGYVKPDCVLFGEDLPDKYYDAVRGFKRNKDGIDLLVVLGTSLSVQPISNLPDQVNPNAIRVVFNLDLNDEIKEIFEFEAKRNQRDIFIGGKCDESIDELCKLLKWDKQLNEICETSNEIAKKINDELNK